MKKYYIISIIAIIIFAILVVSGIIIYNNMETNRKISNRNEIINNVNEMKNNLTSNNIELVTTASEEEKISPNSIFIFKTYYKECEHIKVEKEIVTETMVNKTKEDLEKIYKNWNIVTFRNDEVLFYKEEEGICGEHYLLKELEGKIAIYIIDDENNLNLYEETEIITNYLPEEDITRIREGIRVNGRQELNEALEDYE